MRNTEEVRNEKGNFLRNIPWKKIGWKLLFPHTFIVFLMFNITVVGLLYIFINHMDTTIQAIVFYVISFYTLVIVCAKIPGIVKKVKGGLHSNKYTHRYLSDHDLRMYFSIYRGLIINMAFALMKIVMGIVYHSAWLYAVAGYNTILTIMRFVVVSRDKKKGITEEEQHRRGMQSYHVCGWLMLILNIAISVIVFMVVVQKQTIVYHEIMVISLAAFTFYSFTRAIINLVKYRKKNPVYDTIKHIELAKAIVSIFTMQVAMLTRYGGENGNVDTGLFNTLTGTAVVIAVNTMAALMLARIRDIKKEQKNVGKA